MKFTNKSQEPNTPKRTTRSTRAPSNSTTHTPRSTRSTRVEPTEPIKPTKPVKKKSNKKRNGLALALLLLGSSFLAYQPVVNHIIGLKQLDKVHANHLSPEDIQKNIIRHQKDYTQEELDATFDYDSVTTISTLAINPVIDTANVVGGVYVPSVDMMMPIMHGVSQDTLMSSAGTLKPNQLMGHGNYALIGHNSKNSNALFAPTHRIKHDDMMYMTDKGKVYAYRVNSIEIVNPKAIHVIDDVPNSSMLTLVSCTDDGTERVVVQGELVDVFDYEDSDESVIKAFNHL